ncbi:uncharacterized protein NPIL_693751 [Nephila pilipes]|uniref:Uncharacterized protein n=1 Tax=Nephila pilipes TaxID=299642 RepID=A0A8X6NVM2_NEPPI|nr:uncharacterized protein NPIL_693751 [Nephila pilipes]
MLENSDHSPVPMTEMVPVNETQSTSSRIYKRQNGWNRWKSMQGMEVKIDSLLNMEFKALELEIKYFLIFLRNLIRAKKKESLELDRRSKIPPKGFYEYVHNPPDSVYVFVAVCIIVIFVLGLGIYLLYLLWGIYFKRMKKTTGQDQKTEVTGSSKSKSFQKYHALKTKFENYYNDIKHKNLEKSKVAELKNKLESFCKGLGSNAQETREFKHDRYGMKDTESLEDVISRCSKMEEDNVLDQRDRRMHKTYLKQKLVKTGDTRIDCRLTPDEYTKIHWKF